MEPRLKRFCCFGFLKYPLNATGNCYSGSHFPAVIVHYILQKIETGKYLRPTVLKTRTCHKNITGKSFVNTHPSTCAGETKVEGKILEDRKTLLNN